MIKIYTDGGACPNPGAKAIGIVIDDDGKQEEFFKRLGYGTNNEAEYEACIEALRIAKRKGFKKFTMCLDSMLVLKQLSGEWKVKNEKFLDYIGQFEELKKSFEEINFFYVRGEKNLAHTFVEKQLQDNEVPIFQVKKE